jgi:hypothetical protein
MVAASKHAFSFGAAGFATLAFLAIENSDTCNENAATDNQPSPYATERCSDARLSSSYFCS